jgi:hypothetical protein
VLGVPWTTLALITTTTPTALRIGKVKGHNVGGCVPDWMEIAFTDAKAVQNILLDVSFPINVQIKIYKSIFPRG